jgi:hypothetical protein
MNIRQHVGARGPDTATSVRTSAKPAFRFSFIIVFLGLDKRVPTPGKKVSRFAGMANHLSRLYRHCFGDG